MKKIIAFLLAAALCCAMFILPGMAAGDNEKVDIKYATKAPTVDGKVSSGEYVSALPTHDYSATSTEIASYQEHNKLTDLHYEFYICWTETDLYMAWKVYSSTFGALPEQYYTETGNMWMYSCVQFILTPGAPDNTKATYQTAQWSGNYLEVGLALREDGESCKVAWSKPAGAEALTVDDWDAAIIRDEANKVTTYEVRLPWNKTGVQAIGNEAQFGLTYAVAGQEDYNVTPGMLEWPNAILGGKNADNAGIMTLTGHKEMEITSIEVEPGLVDGTLPTDYVAGTSVALTIDAVDTSVGGNTSRVFTDPSKIADKSTAWSQVLLLAPVEGKDGVYSVVENIAGDGTGIKFSSEITTGMIALAFHANDIADGSEQAARKIAASGIAVGTELKLFGIDLTENKVLYKNSMVYTTDGSAGETTSETETTSEASSEAETTSETSKAASSAAASSEAAEEGSSLLWLWIVIGVVVVAGAAVAVVMIIRKKKQA